MNFSRLKYRNKVSEWLSQAKPMSDAEQKRCCIRIYKKRVKTYQTHINNLDNDTRPEVIKFVDQARPHYRKVIKHSLSEIEKIKEKL